MANTTDSKSPSVQVQFGCGLCAPEGWSNFDASPRLKLRRVPLLRRLVPAGKYGDFPPNVLYGDIVLGLPLPAGSVDYLYCSHVLEHLALDDFRRALRSCFDLLKPGGTFRFVLPDIEFMARQYVDSNEPDAAMRFMEVTYLGRSSRAKGLRGFVTDWLGNSRHLWMWDFKALSKELADAGFKNIRRASFNDSRHRCFNEVEEESRWKNELGIECEK